MLDWIRFTDGDTLAIKIANSSTTYNILGIDYTTDEWQHFILTRGSDNAIKAYRNKIAASNSSAKAGTFTPDNIGSKAGGGFFDGEMRSFILSRPEKMDFR